MNRILAISGLSMAAAMLVSNAGCHSSTPAATSNTATAAGPARVTAIRPVRKTLRLESVQPGQIEAFECTPLYAKLAAYVEELHVDIGDRVEADQLLADLYLPELGDEVHQKEAALAEADAGIEQAVATVLAAEAASATAEAKISETEAGIIRVDADYTRWESQYARMSDLAAKGSVDHKLEDEARNSLKAAEAARSEARAKLESAKALLVESRAAVTKAKASEGVARARRASAQADLSRQKALLSYTQIRAPYAGVVTERNVDRGDFVQPASGPNAKPLLTVARTDIVRLFVDVTEMDSPWVETGQTALVNVQAIPSHVVEGKVARTGWALGANRTLRTELDVANPDGVLRPGMYAMARILLQEHSDVLVLPPSAIVRDGAQNFCWVTSGGQAARTPITLGLQVGTDVEIISGLSGDELVIQLPPTTLHEGDPVEMAEPSRR